MASLFAVLLFFAPLASLDAIPYQCEDCLRIAPDFALCQIDRTGIGGYKMCWVERECDVGLCFEYCYTRFHCMWA